MRFEFSTASRIVFGSGAVREAAVAARKMGTRALLVTGAAGRHAAGFREQLSDAGVACELCAIEGEPTVEAVRAAVCAARRASCDLVISLGGGSAIDGGKAVAALLANEGDPLDYLEVIGKGRPLDRPSAPFIAIPTTAGTGSEVTRNAVLASPEHGVKASLRSPHMLPRLAVVDPELTRELPRALTASTGMDALTQLIEPFVSSRRNACTDLFCTEGIRRAARSLEAAWRDGSHAEARADMAMASLLGGLALANAGLGAVHGFAAPVGGRFPAPHGAVCAALLPHVMSVNLRALSARAPGPDIVARYQTVARLLTGDDAARAEDGVAWVVDLRRKLEIPPLAAYGISRQDIPDLAALASRASSMKANPIKLRPEELHEILERAL